MLSAPGRKLLRDLWLHRGRTLLVVLSIGVGVAGVGAIGQARSVAIASMTAAHAAARPPGAILQTEWFDEAMVEEVRRLEGVGDAEGRYAIVGRARAAGTNPGSDESGWKEFHLFAVADDGKLEISRILPVEGVWPPPPGEVALERTSLAYLGLTVGDTLLVEMPDGSAHPLRIGAAVQEPGRETSFVSGTGYGYITMESLRLLGGHPGYNLLYLTVAGERLEKEQIQRVTDRARRHLEASGRHVYQMILPPPDRHWAAAIIESMSVILGRMGFLLLLMGSALVVNTILGLMARESRQIGIMKALGAGTGQITRLYLGMVLLFGLLAIGLGAPLGALAARQIMTASTYYLNFAPPALSIAPPVMGLMAAVGLAIPLLAALGPVIAGSRTSPLEAIHGSAIGRGFRPSRFDRLLERVRHLSRPLLLSLRNTFRRKGRLLLTLAVLSLSGAMLIAVVSLRASLDLTLNHSLRLRQYDLEVILDRAYPLERVEQTLLATPGIERAESWGLRAVRRIRPDGSESGDLTLVAPPPDTPLLQPILTAGRWLHPTDDRALVLETGVLREEPGIAVGDRVRLRIQGKETEWEVVGLVRKALGEPLLYVNRAALAKVTGDESRAVMMEVVTSRHDRDFQAQVARELQLRLEQAGIEVLTATSTGELREMTAARFRIITLFLGSMAALMALVAALGLAGTMSLGVLERTRELGVMRTIGATHGAVWRIVVGEGIIIGLIGWLLGSLLAYPISLELSRSVGEAIVQTPLDYAFSFAGVALWLGGSVILSMLASFIPAWNAARLNVREVLAYE